MTWSSWIMINLDIKLWQVGGFNLEKYSSNCIIFRRLQSKNLKKTLKPSSPWPFETFCLCFSGPRWVPRTCPTKPMHCGRFSKAVRRSSSSLRSEGPPPENTKAKDRPELGGFWWEPDFLGASLYFVLKHNTTEKSGLWFLVSIGSYWFMFFSSKCLMIHALVMTV